MHFLHLTIKLALQRDIVNVTAHHFAPLTTKVAQLKLLKAPFSKSHAIYEISIFNIFDLTYFVTVQAVFKPLFALDDKIGATTRYRKCDSPPLCPTYY